MMKLLKYEIRKGIIPKLILIGLYALVEGIFLYGCFAHKADTVMWTTVLAMILGVGSFLFIGVQSMMTLHHDMNSKQGYMLFMTPRSCYAILGAKMIEALIALAITAGIAIGTVCLNSMLITKHFSNIHELTDLVQNMMRMVNVNLDASNVAAYFLSLLSSWIFMITTAYLADVLISSLLRGKKGAGILAFILFIALNWALNSLLNFIHVGDTLTAASLVQDGVSLAASAIMYYITALVMEKKLSV